MGPVELFAAATLIVIAGWLLWIGALRVALCWESSNALAIEAMRIVRSRDQKRGHELSDIESELRRRGVRMVALLRDEYWKLCRSYMALPYNEQGDWAARALKEEMDAVRDELNRRGAHA